MQSDNSEVDNEVKIGNMFSINMNKKLGSGAFGEIYRGINLKTDEEVAMKLESVKSKTPQLNYESKILKYLQGGVGIPAMYQVSTLGEYTIMVMEILDKNLDELMNLNQNKKFSLKTVLMIAEQILSRIEFIHMKGIIHRDIKPENFVLGIKKKSHLIYLIDYGLSKKFQDIKTGEHIPYLEGKSLTGTARYASIYTHLGIEQSRRDDLESIGYLLVYLLKGELPWQGLKAKNKKEKYKKIMDKKIEETPDAICKDIPVEFTLFFKYVRELQFEEKPNYQYIKDLFKKLFMRHDYYNDFAFDWVLRMKEEQLNATINNQNQISLLTRLNKGNEDESKNNNTRNNQQYKSGSNELLPIVNKLNSLNLKSDQK